MAYAQIAVRVVGASNTILENLFGGGGIILSNATIAEAAANSTVVGTASLGGSITGTPTWGLTDASSTFSIDSSSGVITVTDNTDLATNASFSVTITVSGTTPDPSDLVTTIYVVATAAVIDLKSTSDTGASSSDNNTSTTQPTISFTATLYTGDFVTFYDNAASFYSTTISSGEASSKDIVLARTLSDGAHPITATISRGGHENTVSNSLSITVDTAAPVLSSASGTTTGSTTASLSVATDTTAGTLYYAVTTSASPPSVSDLKDGTGSVDFGSDATPTNPTTFSVMGLTAETTYYAHYIQDDAAGNTSAIVSSSAFTTDVAGGTEGQPMGLLLVITYPA